MERKIEVFHYTHFSTDKEYEMATSIIRQGIYPDYRYFTVAPLIYIGRYVKYVSIEYGENAGGVEIFVNNEGKEIRIPWDFEIHCYREKE